MSDIDPATISEDIDMKKWLLAGKKMPAYFRESITGGSIQMTIEGASTLTLVIDDNQRKLIKSKFFFGGDRYDKSIRSGLPAKKPLRLRALDLDWQLVKFDWAEDGTMTLVFEDLRVAIARTRRKAKKVSRGKKTRAKFLLSLWNEIKRPKIIFVCPQLNKKQSVAKSSSSDKDDDRGKGFAKSSSLKIKGVKASSEQLRNLDKALSAADGENASEKIMIALVMAAIQENNAKNTGSDGMFQVLPSTARSLGIDSKDIAECAAVWVAGKNGSGFRGSGKYAQAIVKNKPSISLNDLAQAVEGSAHAGAYGKHESEARRIVDAFGGGARSKSSKEYSKYEFSRGKPGGPKGEDTWACSQRLAAEVGWRLFCVRNRIYFMSEEDLIRSRPRATIKESTKGISGISFSVDSGRKVDECTLTCTKSLWSAPPGSVVLIEEMGPADGRWLVTTISRSNLWSTQSSIELRRGSALLGEKKEPAAEAGSSNNPVEQSGSSGPKGTVKIAKGANRPGTSISSETMDFLEEVAGEYGGTIIVTTGTNHDRLTVDGNVSDHYDGHAADIAVPVDSAKGDKIAAAALRAAGLTSSEATRKAKYGGLYSISGNLRVQVIWKTNAGGNHHNHVHIGAR